MAHWLQLGFVPIFKSIALTRGWHTLGGLSQQGPNSGVQQGLSHLSSAQRMVLDEW
jgi:hypothetical protein